MIFLKLESYHITDTIIQTRCPHGPSKERTVNTEHIKSNRMLPSVTSRSTSRKTCNNTLSTLLAQIDQICDLLNISFHANCHRYSKPRSFQSCIEYSRPLSTLGKSLHLYTYTHCKIHIFSTQLLG